MGRSRIAAETADWTTHDIEIISNFRQLRDLEIYRAPLNGTYPVLFNFPLLQKLRIDECLYLKWDLGMLAGFPMLKELDCWGNRSLAGNINSLRVLKDTIETVSIEGCGNVEGNFMDLADFPQLKVLGLVDTAVTGDICDIRENCFPSLECLYLPKGVYGGVGYEFQSIDDGPDVARAVYLLSKQHPSLEYLWYGHLSKDSPDWYRSRNTNDSPPFCIKLVRAGHRIGYRWTTSTKEYPFKDSSDIKGFKLRIPPSNSIAIQLKSLGIEPVQTPIGQLIKALKSKKAYGQENPPSYIPIFKINTVQNTIWVYLLCTYRKIPN